MAKKRKLRSSEPEQQQEEELQVKEEQTVKDEPLQPIKEEEQTLDEPLQQDNMDEDGAKEEQEQDQEEEEGEDEEEGEGYEEEEEDQEGNLNPSNDGVSTEAAAAAAAAAVDANGDNHGEDLGEEPIEKVLEPFGKDQLIALLKEAVDRFPDFMDSVRKLADADPAHRKIFVHGLGWDTTAETLTSEFGKYGEIEDCKAVTDKVSGKSKGYAFILFKHRSGAQKALKEPQKKIGSRMTSCQLASAGPVPAPPPVAPPVSEYTLRKIFVSNVSADIDPQKLLEFFKQYGEIEDGPLGLDKNTGKPKGFALFVYKSVESAKKALEEPHKNFDGHTLHCQKAIDGPKPNKPHHQHHYQPHYPSRKEKNKYSSGGGSGQGHLMAPAGPAMGFNPAVAAQAAQGMNPAIGQALALLATQGGLSNLLGGLGGVPGNQAGPPPMSNPGYPGQAVNYGNQQVMQGGYQNPQAGQSSGVRSQQGYNNMGGAPYMGH